MIITLIGSTQYSDKFAELRNKFESEGHTVLLPAFDNDNGMDELEVCEYNRSAIERADEVHIIWNNRSSGTIFDFGMCFALRKKIVIEYIEDKTFENLFKQYEQSCWE